MSYHIPIYHNHPSYTPNGKIGLIIFNECIVDPLIVLIPLKKNPASWIRLHQIVLAVRLEQ